MKQNFEQRYEPVETSCEYCGKPIVTRWQFSLSAFFLNVLISAWWVVAASLA